MTDRRGRTRTDVRRAPQKQVRDRAALDALLDSALVAHLAVVETTADGVVQPYVVPVGVARDGDRLLVHGSTASRAFRALAAGAPTCATVTILDGVVVARSQFESSMNYRSAMVLGRCTELVGEDKERALAVLSEHLLPGLTAQRTPTRKESAATSVLALPLEEWSLKVSAKDGPEDDPADLDRQAWAGLVPLHHTWGEPVDAPDLAAPYPVPEQIAGWPQGRT
ncbi:pyridoxamine 5'-phosphate oxidase family protein [Kineosporia sp. A_224]|uniref:pyridoxamine 5'-phosphate oxidase family protein n=1 Tax=Kineosporia sp. A_224 TaxID=1962180 RepID=UPI0018EA1A42|nr:pyridoxamine 5'-phosphate oxidase family protein [Kineosporia sp. A_224]